MGPDLIDQLFALTGGNCSLTIGSSSTTVNGVTYNHRPRMRMNGIDSVEMNFPHLPTEKECQRAWNLYQKYIRPFDPSHKLDITTRVKNIQKQLSKFNCKLEFEQPLQTLAENPKEYLRVAKEAHAFIKEIFIYNLKKNRGLRITHGRFDDSLDQAKGETDKILVDLVIYYLTCESVDEEAKEEPLDLAFQTAIHLISAKGKGAVLLQIANRYIEEKRAPQAFVVLNELDSAFDYLEVLTLSIRQLIQVEGADRVVAHAKKMTNEYVRDAILSQVVNHYAEKGEVEKGVELVNLIKSSSKKGDALKQIVKSRIKGKDYAGALNLIPSIESYSTRDQLRLQIIDRRFAEGDMLAVLRLVPTVESYSSRDNERMRVINHYKSQEMWERAFKLISDVESYSTRDEERVKFVDMYLKANDIAAAETVIKEIESYSERDKQRLCLIDWCLQKKLIEKAKKIRNTFESSSEKERATERLLAALT